MAETEEFHSLLKESLDTSKPWGAILNLLYGLGWESAFSNVLKLVVLLSPWGLKKLHIEHYKSSKIKAVIRTSDLSSLRENVDYFTHDWEKDPGQLGKDRLRKYLSMFGSIESKEFLDYLKKHPEMLGESQEEEEVEEEQYAYDDGDCSTLDHSEDAIRLENADSESPSKIRRISSEESIVSLDLDDGIFETSFIHNITSNSIATIPYNEPSEVAKDTCPLSSSLITLFDDRIKYSFSDYLKENYKLHSIQDLLFAAGVTTQATTLASLYQLADPIKLILKPIAMVFKKEFEEKVDLDEGVSIANKFYMTQREGMLLQAFLEEKLCSYYENR